MEIVEDYSKKQNSFQVFFNVFRGNIGAGIFAAPFAFKLAGFAPSIFAFVFILICACYLSLELINVKNMSKINFNRAYIAKVETFGDLGYVAFGKKGRWSINILLFITQFGISAAYLGFFAEMLVDLFPHLLGKRIYVFIIWLICCLFSMTKNLKFVSFLSLKSMIGYLYGLVILWLFLTYGITLDGNEQFYPDSSLDCHWFPFTETNTIDTLKNIFYVFSVAVYCFEGIGIVIPLEENARHPDYFKYIFIFTLTFIVGIIIFFSATIYNFHCQHLPELIIQMLPKDNLLAHSARIAIGSSLIASFVIQMFPIIQIVEDEIIYNYKWSKFLSSDQGFDSNTINYISERESLIINEDEGQQGVKKIDIKLNLYEKFIFGRLFPCMIPLLMALLIPNFDKLVTLIGGSAACILLFCVPAILKIKIFRSSLNYKSSKDMFCLYFQNIILIALGIILMIICTILNVISF